MNVHTCIVPYICRTRWPPLLNGTMIMWTYTGPLVLSVTKIPGENVDVIIVRNNTNQISCCYGFLSEVTANMCFTSLLLCCFL